MQVGSACYLTLGSGGPIGAGVVGCAAAPPLWLPYVAVDGLDGRDARSFERCADSDPRPPDRSCAAAGEIVLPQPVARA